MTTYEVLEYLCSVRNKKITNVEKELGFSKGSLSKLKKSTPTANRSYVLASYFDVPQDFIFRPEQFRTETELAIAIKDHTYVSEAKNVYMVSELKKTPVYDVAAGDGAYNDTYADTYEDLETNDGESWCEIHGDSMYPELHDGDRVRIRHQTETAKTDLTVVKVDGEHVTVKYVEIVENGVWLRAINKTVYEDHFFTVSEVMTLPIKIVGKVVEVRRTY